MSKKRVLLVINTPLANAGVPHVIMSIIKGLKENYDFDLVSYSSSLDKGDREKEFLSYGGNIYKFKVINYLKYKIFFFINYFIIKMNISKIIKKGNYDIIHCHNGIESGIVLKVAKKNDINIRITHAHGRYDRKGKNLLLRFYNILNKNNIEKYATNKLACSFDAGNSLYLSGKFNNVYNPVEVSKYSSIVYKKHDIINLLQIGYFCNNKNQIFSIEVLNNLISKGKSAILYFIGFICDQNYYTSLINKIKQYKLENNVIFLDKNVEKSKYFNIIDFLLLPSFSEGLSITTLEAQSANIPCIVSSCIPKDCDCGLVKFLDNNSPQLWASYIINYKRSGQKINQKKMGKIDLFGYCKEIEKIYTKYN